MTLPTDFHFSQSSLQDFVDCPRRFQLRYLMQVQWPAEASAPSLQAELSSRMGADFHLLVHQYLIKIPPSRLAATIAGSEIAAWWQNFLEFTPTWTTGQASEQPARYPELQLAAELEGTRLVAKLDLLVRLSDSKFRIMDWKTSARRPSRTWLAARIQTRFYPLVLLLGGIHLNNNEPISPDMVEMVYWFAGSPEQPERFAYDTETFQEDLEYFSRLIDRINTSSEDDFPLTEDISACQFCRYRSLCDRGISAGDWLAGEKADTESPEDFQLDFNQIGEIEF